MIGHAIGRAEIKRVMCGCLISCVATAASPRNAASPAPDEWRQWAGLTAARTLTFFALLGVQKAPKKIVHLMRIGSGHL
ncbi:MAG: hypothetical protein KJO78_12425, partial [Alphaproteobacteria bacterium]|nr:hypothetical protein [Alphaproteobacteria bacterium]